jgi:putative membrane-bound dehydrogenase-like protein
MSSATPATRLRFVLAGLVLLVVSIGELRASAAAAQPIFDGRTLAGWDGNPQAWRVEDGAITGEIGAGGRLGKNEFIYWTGGEVHDFELTLEYRLTGHPSANSGIQIRSQRQPDGHAAGYQADIDHGGTWLGRIYDEHGRKLLVERGTRVSIAPDGRRWAEKFAEPGDFKQLARPAGEWNTYRILAAGPHLEIWINGVRVSALQDHEIGQADHSGVLALQLHSGPGPVKIQFRNIRLAQLGRTPLPPPIPAPPATAPPPVAAPAAGRTPPPRPKSDPPLRRVAGAEDTTRARESAVLWHLRPNPARPTSVPNSAAQKLVSGMLLPHGFQAELIAAEPDLRQPIAFTFDERGRIWVAEAYGYPNRQPEGQGKDRIVIFEDRDGDGTFETRKVFCENLNLVSGIEVGFGGVWIGAAPDLLFIPDRNRDDVPDGPAEVLLDGWGYQDTHETLNSFTWGPDGWLYGCHGVFTHSNVGKPGTPAGERRRIRAGVWRYHPVRHVFEVFAAGGSNQWGIGFNEVGALFMTHCRSFHGEGGTSYVIRNGHYWNQVNADYAPFISNRAPHFAPGLKNFLRASARYDSGEGGAGKPGTTAVYGGHSHVGSMIYLGDNWPDIYRDNLFTHNLHGHQINHQRNVRQGSGYETFHAGYDMLFAPDPTHVGVDLRYGPDGAVYAIDWSDTQHCHNPRDEVWDRTNGRLYRVSWVETYRPVKVDLAAHSDRELAALHAHKSEWYVRTARRLLQERAATRAIDPAALAALADAVRSGSDKQADPAAAVVPFLRSFWTLHAVGALDDAHLRAALAHPADVVRAWAVHLATDGIVSELGLPAAPSPSRRLSAGAPVIPAAELARLALSDPSPAVRLALASVVPLLAGDVQWPVVSALSSRAEDAGDRYLPNMIWYALAPLVDQNLPRALDLAASSPMPALSDSVLWFAARTPAGRDQIGARLEPAATHALSEAAVIRALRVLAFALDNEAGLTPPAGWDAVLSRFASSADAAVRAAAEQLAVLFGDRAVLTRTRTVLADTSAPLADRRRALDLLKRAGDTESTALLVRLLEEDALRSAVIPLLASASDSAAAGAGLIRHFPRLAEMERTAALGALTGRPPLALVLLRAIEGGTFDRRHLTALHARQLRNLRNEEVNTMLDRVWGRAGESAAGIRAAIVRMRQVYRDAPVWAYEAEAGRKVYDQLCAACHVMDGAGGNLGPDLTGSWRNGLDYFLESIIDPNAVVGASYQLNLITKRDGTVVSGMIERETDTVLVVRTVTENVNVPKADIRERQTTSQSLMPAGLIEALPEREALELLKFLTTAPARR